MTWIDYDASDMHRALQLVRAYLDRELADDPSQFDPTTEIGALNLELEAARFPTTVKRPKR